MSKLASRLLALLMAVVMVCAMLPLGTLAEVQNGCLDGCTDETHAAGCPNAATQSGDDSKPDVKPENKVKCDGTNECGADTHEATCLKNSTPPRAG